MSEEIRSDWECWSEELQRVPEAQRIKSEAEKTRELVRFKHNAERHDLDDPISYMRLLEVTAWIVKNPQQCPHCAARQVPLPEAGTAWAIEVRHEAECPITRDDA